MGTTIKKPDKQSLCYLAIVLIVALFVFAGLWYYLSRPTKTEAPAEAPKEETLEEKQLRQLEELRKIEVIPLTEEEIKKQLEELEKLRQ